MSYEAVDVYVHANSLSGIPLASTVVRVFSADGLTAITQAMTDTSGRASLLLEGGFDYQLRFFKFQVAFRAPVLISVLADPDVVTANNFDVWGEVQIPPTSPNPWLCVAYGYFKKQTLSAAPNTEIHFIGKFDPIMVDGAAVVAERSIVHTDDKGYVQVNLIRGAEYDVTLAGMEDVLRTVSVPDLPNVNVADLLFPVVASVTFAESPPYSMGVGGRIYLTPTITSSTGLVIPGVGRGDVLWSVSDDSVVMLDATDTRIVLTGRAPGIARLIARRADQSVIRLPSSEIRGQPVSLLVTP